MAFSAFSWPFRRRGSGGGGGGGGGPSKPAAEADEEELGVTPQLLDFLRTLSPDTFKSSALQLQGNPHAPLPSPTRSGSALTPARCSRAGDPAGDLTGWQERHAVLVLSKATVGRVSPHGSVLPSPASAFIDPNSPCEVLLAAKCFVQGLAKIRYDLCPRHMKDKQFWRMYFLLARSYTAPYELRAIQKEKVGRMETENRNPEDVITIEVEMQESKCSRESHMLTVDSESQD